MAADFKGGDHVEWNPEAGRVRGTIRRKVTREIVFKGYRRHASREEPQYIFQSDKTDHLAIHKGSALLRQTAAESFVDGDFDQVRVGVAEVHRPGRPGRSRPGHRAIQSRLAGIKVAATIPVEFDASSLGRAPGTV